jgi:hypothetical protein
VSLLIACSGVCLFLAIFPPFYGPILTCCLDQFLGDRSILDHETKELIRFAVVAGMLLQEGEQPRGNFNRYGLSLDY